MPRYKLTIAYDGTDFCGWQKQEPPIGSVAPELVLRSTPPGESEPFNEHARERHILRTVQEVVEQAVREVVREPIVLIGASRTDSGVHARGQVAAFTCSDGAGRPEPPPPPKGTPPRGQDKDQQDAFGLVLAGVAADAGGERSHGGWPVARGVERLVRAVNGRLPSDCVLLSAEPVAPTFDPIGDCTAKGYSYLLHVCRTRPLWDRDFVHHVWSPLDLDRMNAAAAEFVGEHDFAAFAAAGHGRLSTVRTVFDCRVVDESETARQRDSEVGGPDTARRLRIEISGNGFLWNMVRIIAGTLVDVGLGRRTPQQVAAAIASKDRRNAGPTLAATGLCLDWVRYG